MKLSLTQETPCNFQMTGKIALVKQTIYYQQGLHCSLHLPILNMNQQEANSWSRLQLFFFLVLCNKSPQSEFENTHYLTVLTQKSQHRLETFLISSCCWHNWPLCSCGTQTHALPTYGYDKSFFTPVHTISTSQAPSIGNSDLELNFLKEKRKKEGLSHKR